MKKIKGLVVSLVLGIISVCLSFCAVNFINANATTSFAYTSQMVIRNNSIFDIEGGTIQNANAEKGGAVYIAGGGVLNMSAGTIYNCSAIDGGAIYIANGATFNMTGGIIKECSATSGGAIYIANGGTCNLTKGTIESCRGSFGNAIYVEAGGVLNIGEEFVFTNCGDREFDITYYENADITVRVYKDNTFIKTITATLNDLPSSVGVPTYSGGCGWYTDYEGTTEIDISIAFKYFCRENEVSIYYLSHRGEGEWVTVREATNVQDGTERRLCSVCHQYLYNELHWFVTNREVASTCTQQGYILLQCINCYIYQIGEDLPIDPDNHTSFWVRDKTEATCTSVGYIYNQCEDCGVIIPEEIPIDEDNHAWVLSEEVPATCSSTGYKKYICERECGIYSQGEELPIDPYNHTFVEGEEFPATCSDWGYIVNTCSGCGLVRNITTNQQPTGYHDYSNYGTMVIQYEPTCYRDGLAYIYCSYDCGRYVEYTLTGGHEESSPGSGVCRFCGEVFIHYNFHIEDNEEKIIYKKEDMLFDIKVWLEENA